MTTIVSVPYRSLTLLTLMACVWLTAWPALSQDGGWSHWGSAAGSTRYTPLEQIDAENFQELAVAWVWRGDNFGPSADNILRSTSIFGMR